MKTTPEKSSHVKQEPAYKTMIAEDHEIFRHGLKNLLNKYSFIQCTGEANNGVELLQLIKNNPPDIVFLDLHMPGGPGIEALDEITESFPQIKVIILSFFDDVITIEKMLKLGACAYLTKNISAEVLDKMFEKVLKGEVYICPVAAKNMQSNRLIPTVPQIPAISEQLEREISSRERQVLKMIAQGNSNKAIGIQLGISDRTVETHKTRLMQKLGAKNTAELISIAYEYRLL